MSDLSMVIAVAAVTFASRASYLLLPSTRAAPPSGRFLEVFPLALFVALATVGLMAPDGAHGIFPALAAAGGGVLGAFVWKRRILATVAAGMAAYWLARLLAG
jgi:branched-subunit amino acid transport protein